MSSADNLAERAVRRVRHPLKFRLLQVARVQTVTPWLTRVTLAGDDLDDFVSASFDDHIKLFFPAPGADRPVLPTVGPDGAPGFAGERPLARDFTPRRYDRAARELDIEFALHDAGPAATWAKAARPGQYLGIGGPRGSMIVPMDYDWHLLIGDDSALPAIARRLEELPAGRRVFAVVEVAAREARIELPSAADATVLWCHRDGSTPALLDTVRGVALPEGDGYVWAAGESAAMRALRDHLRDERGIDRARMRVSSYWKNGAVAVHESLDD